MYIIHPTYTLSHGNIYTQVSQRKEEDHAGEGEATGVTQISCNISNTFTMLESIIYLQSNNQLNAINIQCDVLNIIVSYSTLCPKR